MTNSQAKSKNEEEKTEEDSSKRLYRNAELIAKFYKYVGLLANKNSMPDLG